ncbi:MAG: pyrroline-5-carboxylate reductase [Gemmatimonadota bacterium]|nr:pyrroline-5-carboxylate reductase [Gemmatimonadota bacterium]
MSVNKTPESSSASLAILGCGNLGKALARGLVRSGTLLPDRIQVTRRNPDGLEDLAAEGFPVGTDNIAAIRASETVLIAVQPQQIADLLDQLCDELDPARHTVISVVSGVPVSQLREMIPAPIPVVRAMPNTAVSIGESMTCLSADSDSMSGLEEAEALFKGVGLTLRIQDEMMVGATALCACGIAFFLRSVRAASQGGIEIGFHAEDALLLAAQTARGAASLAVRDNQHPESEIDRVTTPRGCTIAGLNEMEHQGFSSAMIKGFLLSARKAGVLFDDGDVG